MNKTLIYRTKAVEEDKVGNNFLVSKDNLDCEHNFDEVYGIYVITSRWVSAKTVADLNNGKHAAVKNESFRALLSNMALHTKQYPQTYFIEKERDDV